MIVCANGIYAFLFMLYFVLYERDGNYRRDTVSDANDGEKTKTTIQHRLSNCSIVASVRLYIAVVFVNWLPNAHMDEHHHAR